MSDVVCKGGRQLFKGEDALPMFSLGHKLKNEGIRLKESFQLTVGVVV